MTALARLRGWRPGKASIRIAFTLGLVVLLAFIVDLRTAARLLWSADSAWLGAAYLALTLQTVVSAARWRITAARLDHGFSLLVAVREYYLAQFLNQTLPGGMVGDAGRAFRARGGAGLVRAGQAVLFERMSGQIALVLLAAPGLALSALLPGGIRWPAVIGTAALVVAGLLVLLPLLVLGGARAPGAVGRASRDFLDAARFALFDRDIRYRQIVLSLGTALCTLVAFTCCAVATGTVIGPFAMLTVVPLILLAMIVPLSVAGWGVRESAAAMLFPVVGASAEAGLAASVAFGLVFLSVTLPGGAILLWDMRRRVRHEATSGGDGEAT
jgi:uncharacterized membrane protein YbhN (UPF0104 family)